MLEIVSHRCNSIEKLCQTEPRWGVEVDVRTLNGEIILSHDRGESGPLLAEWLEFFKHKLLILNVKEDGLEEDVTRLLESKQVTQFFFLDQPFPSVVACIRRAEKRCAVRVSDLEGLEAALNIAGKVEWAWVDSFSPITAAAEQVANLTHVGFKTCLVSPELQGRDLGTELDNITDDFANVGIRPTAVCTKYPSIWSTLGW